MKQRCAENKIKKAKCEINVWFISCICVKTYFCSVSIRFEKEPMFFHASGLSLSISSCSYLHKPLSFLNAANTLILLTMDSFQGCLRKEGDFSYNLLCIPHNDNILHSYNYLQKIQKSIKSNGKTLEFCRHQHFVPEIRYF